MTLSRPLVMGIVNVTPDSFYDGGRYTHEDVAVAHAQRLYEDGAAIIDIGGESTRPGSVAIAEEEEMARVLPVIQGIVRECPALISIDTRHAAVARAACDAGAHIVNDVGGMRDASMREVVAEYKAGAIVMHMHGTPDSMQDSPLEANDVVETVRTFFNGQRLQIEEHGIDMRSIIWDPGIGFGKTYAANERLICHVNDMRVAGRPVCIGASRKAFVGERTGRNTPEERLYGSLAAHVAAVLQGADVIRTHDVKATCDAVRMACALRQQMPQITSRISEGV